MIRFPNVADQKVGSRCSPLELDRNATLSLLNVTILERRLNMTKERLAAFSDGVFAIIITIMVLELRVPHGADWSVLAKLIPVALSYALSFVYIAIYWHNHHHLLYATQRVNGSILWANTHLLFWLSLIPFATGWMGENNFAVRPTALYGVALLMPAVAYFLLQTIIARTGGFSVAVAAAFGRDIKGKLSIAAYAAAVGLSFLSPLISLAIYVAVALLWLVPDRRIEDVLRHDPE